MTSPRAFHAVLFDMDGLMLDTERIAAVAGIQACADFGFTMTAEIQLQLIGRNSRDSDVFLSSHFGPTFDAAAVRERFRIRYEEQLFGKGGVPVKDGLYEMLDWLESLPLPKAVATSTRHDIALKKLEHAKVVHRFPHIVGGDQVARGKPEPDIFLEAARRLGVEPTGCVVLEDSEPGVRAALAAGMTPIMIPDIKPPTAELLALGITVCASLMAAQQHLAARLAG